MKWLGYWIERPARGIIAVAALLAILVSGFPYFEEMIAEMAKTTDGSGGNVTLTNPTFNAPAQVGGQHDTMKISQPAFFVDAKVDQLVIDGRHHTRVTLVPSPGRTWAPGTEIAASIRLDRPCAKWTFDPDGAAFGGVVSDTMTGVQENTDEVAFQTTAAMRSGASLVFDMEGEQPMKVVSLGMKPRGS
jgi:hypothetical protein